MSPQGLRSQRLALGMTQGELGKALGLGPRDPGRTVRRWELGERKIPGWLPTLIDLLTLQ